MDLENKLRKLIKEIKIEKLKYEIKRENMAQRKSPRTAYPLKKDKNSCQLTCSR